MVYIRRILSHAEYDGKELVATLSEFLSVGFSYAWIPNSKRLSWPEVYFFAKKNPRSGRP
jgi:hypothetical protein